MTRVRRNGFNAAARRSFRLDACNAAAGLTVSTMTAGTASTIATDGHDLPLPGPAQPGSLRSPALARKTIRMTQVDTEKFRLRRFVEKLAQEGECTVHDDPIDLIDVAAVLDCNPKAVWFRAVGPERAELVGNVMGARRRLAAALDTDEPGFPATLRERLEHPAAPIEVSSAQAPVHEVVLTGEQADLTALPVHLQHGLDGAPYISASIDYARDPRTGFTNIGCRRLMLRGPRAAATRFQADRDFVMASGFRCVPLDPSLQGSRTGAKAGFDCTKPFGKGDSAEFAVPQAPRLPQRERQTLEAALARGPATYLELMAALGTGDGREILREFGRLYEEGRLTRLKDGRYALNGGG